MLPADSPFALGPAPGPHPDLTALRAYAAGALPALKQHDIEAHTLDCERCADVLAGLTLSDARTTNQAVIDLRRRLVQRVAELRQAPQMALAHFRAWPCLAAAAALAASLGTGWLAWQQRAAPAAESAAVSAARPAPTGSAPGDTQAVEAARALTSSPNPARAEKLSYAQPSRLAPAVAPQSPTSRDADAPRERRQQKEERAPPQVASAAAGHASRPSGTEAAQVPESARAAESAGSVANLSLESRAQAKKMARPSAVPAATPAAAPAAAPLADQAVAPGLPDKGSPAAAYSRAAETSSTPRTRAALPAPPTLEPAPVGGYQGLRTYLQQQAAAFTPEAGQGAQLRGVVRVRFTVSAVGKPELEQAKILHSLRADYDAAVLRMLAEGPAWVPGVAAGQRAPLPVQVEVLF